MIDDNRTKEGLKIGTLVVKLAGLKGSGLHITS